MGQSGEKEWVRGHGIDDMSVREECVGTIVGETANKLAFCV